MRLVILNRDFQHPADGWYQIEVPGEHLNKDAGVVQVIDETAITSIVNRFNTEADAYEPKHSSPWPGMLIDHEHFKHQADKESVAYGWLMRLENRAGKPFGQIRWTNTGKPAVDGGDYRFFSSEYDAKDLQVLNRGKKPLRVRPLRLDGLTLTNDSNNKGGKAITNRRPGPPLMPPDGCCPECRCELAPIDNPTVGTGNWTCPTCNKNFAGVSASAADKQQQPSQVKNKMKSIATKLGLAAEASEDSILAEVTKLQNRVSTLTPFEEENTTLKNRIAAFDGEQADSLLALHGVKDTAAIGVLKPLLVGLKNREARVAALVNLGHKEVTAPVAKPVARVLNRAGAGAGAETPAAKKVDAATLNDEVRKVMNRDQSKFEDAFNVLKREKPELFAAPEAAQE